MDAKSEICASNHRREHQNSKIVYDVIKGHCRRLTSVYLGKVTMSVQTMDVTPPQLSMCISPAKMPSSQVTGIEMLRKQISLTWPWKQVIGQTKVMLGTIWRFFYEDLETGKMLFFKGLSIHNFVAIGWVVSVLFSVNPRRGCINPLARGVYIHDLNVSTSLVWAS